MVIRTSTSIEACILIVTCEIVKTDEPSRLARTHELRAPPEARAYALAVTRSIYRGPVVHSDQLLHKCLCIHTRLGLGQ